MSESEEKYNDFNIFLVEDFKQYKNTETIKYRWLTDPAGVLYVFRKELHGTFTDAVKGDMRVAAWAPGKWFSVEVLFDD